VLSSSTVTMKWNEDKFWLEYKGSIYIESDNELNNHSQTANKGRSSGFKVGPASGLSRGSTTLKQEM
jgi:hypothetical protein